MPRPQPSPTTVDLFCGAGGFSLGLDNAGFDVALGVDYDEDAIETYQQNFSHPGVHADISDADPCTLLRDHGVDPSDVDAVVGGPPCQGYSIAGDRSPDDPRNSLFDEFLRWVDALDPDIVIAENVPGILSMENGEVIDDILSRLDDLGYSANHQKLNAARYGVPQTRERVFIIAVADGEPEFPEPTHRIPGGDD